MRSLSLLTIIVLLLPCCQQPREMPVSYLPEHANWEENRIEDLRARDGFLNLTGLFWLDPGEYSFGSDSSNSLVFPASFPSKMGSLFVTRNRVLLTPMSSAGIDVDGELITKPAIIYDEETGEYAEMTFGSYLWFVIERAGNLGIRLRNLQHPVLSTDLNIPKFPVDYRWVVGATYVPYDGPKTVLVNNIVGFTYEMEIPGQLKFELGDEEFTLEPIIEGDNFFIIFSDETSALETYGSGRYMYAKIPTEGEEVILDFNKCYNPPCAFTEFATCLIPPKENRLAMRIEAGERDFHLPN